MILISKSDFEQVRGEAKLLTLEEQAIQADLEEQQRYALELQQRKPGLICEVVTVTNNRKARRTFKSGANKKRLIRSGEIPQKSS